MVCDHLPYSPLQILTFHPIGLFDTATVFVFLSGYVCGWHYGGTAVNKSVAEARTSIGRRLLTIVAAHHAVATVTLIAVLRGLAGPLTGRFSARLYSYHPWHAWTREMLFLRESPLLDILKLYILLFGILALILPHLMSTARNLVLFVSAAVWVVDSFEVFPPIIEPLKSVFGFFHPLAWQFLFVLGVWVGTSRLQSEKARWSAPGCLRYGAFAATLIGFIVRHPGTVYVNPFANTDLDLLFSGENVGVLRLINFLCVVIAFAAIPSIWRYRVAHSRFVRPLVIVGQNSLALYAIHTMVVYAAEAAFPHWSALPWFVRTAVALTTCTTLFAPAYLLHWYREWTRDRRNEMRLALAPVAVE